MRDFALTEVKTISGLSLSVSTRMIAVERRLDPYLFSESHLAILRKVGNLPHAQLSKLGYECIRGKTPQESQYTDKGIPVVKVGSVTEDGTIDWAKVSFIPKALRDNFYRKVMLKKEDLIIVATGKGSIGKVGILAEEKNAVIAGENIALRRVDGKVDPYYLLTFFLTEYGREQLDFRAIGPSGQTHLYPEQLYKVLIPIPENHHEIGQLLKQSIHFKLEAQRKRKEIEEIFAKYLPMNFEEPKQISFGFRRSEAPKEYRIDPKSFSPQVQTYIERLKAFKYPLMKLGEIVKAPIRRGTQPDYIEEGEIPVIKTTDVKDVPIDWDATLKIDKGFYTQNTRAQIPKEAIVITSTGEGSWGRNSISTKEEAIADGHITIVEIDDEKINPYYVCAFLWAKYGKAQFYKRVRGCTGQTEIYPFDIETIEVPLLGKQVEMSVWGAVREFIELAEKGRDFGQQAMEEIERLLEA